MTFNSGSNPPTVPVPVDSVDAELEKAKIAARKERRVAVGTLMDKAVDVLSDVLETTDQAHEGARMRAAETAINLYIQVENGERQDRVLDVQERRIALEEKKLLKDAGLHLEQNNVYVVNGVPQPLPQTSEAQEVAAQMLLERKQAQNAALSSYLKKPPIEVDQEPAEPSATTEESDEDSDDNDETGETIV